MHLYFLRHGEAASAGRSSDAERPLTEHGLAQAWAIGTMLQKAGVEPEIVLCSPLLRAKQTAETACMALNIKEFQVSEFLGPTADQRQLFTELSSYHAKTVLIVGHQPFIGEAVALLIAGDGDVHIEVDKGTCVCVEVDSSVQPGTGRLIALLPHHYVVASQR